MSNIRVEADIPESTLWNTRQVIRYLNTSQSTLYKLMSQGKVPRPGKLGGKNVWSKSEIETYAEQLLSNKSN